MSKRVELPQLSDSRQRAWLTKRQREIYSAWKMLGGAKEVAAHLSVSKTTIYKHMRRLKHDVARIEAMWV
jgi:DNA-binding CsgD family transcriptional regulator